MSDEVSLDLSDDEFFDEFSSVVDLISDMLLESADPESLPEDERDSLRTSMDEVALMILAEMDFRIIGRNQDGTVTATLFPKGMS